MRTFKAPPEVWRACAGRGGCNGASPVVWMTYPCGVAGMVWYCLWTEKEGVGENTLSRLEGLEQVGGVVCGLDRRCFTGLRVIF